MTRTAQHQHAAAPCTGRRKALLLTAAVATPWWAPAARAQGPGGAPLKIVVPFAAGGLSDQVARLVGEYLAPLLGQAVIVENRPGAGGRLGSDAVMKAPPDGNTLLLTNVSYTLAPVVDSSAKYDPVTALAPVGTVANIALAVVVGPKVPANTLTELIDHARRNPGKLSYGSAGLGSGAHFFGEYFKWLTGTYIVHIPYRSTTAAVTDVAGGAIDLGFDAAAKPFADAGRVKILAVAGRLRDPRLPNVPTTAEAGLKDFVTDAWSGLLAPAATPPATVERLNQALNRALSDEALRRSLRQLGLAPQGGSPREMRQQIEREVALYRRIAADTKMKFE